MRVCVCVSWNDLLHGSMQVRIRSVFLALVGMKMVVLRTGHLTLQWTSDPMVIPEEILFIACILRTRKKSYDYVHEIIMFIFYVVKCFFFLWFLVFGMDDLQ